MIAAEKSASASATNINKENIITHFNQLLYTIERSILLQLSQDKLMKNRTALKLERYQFEKTQKNMSATVTTFRTHTLAKSDAEIMLPQNYNISQKNNDLIFQVTCGKISFYADLSENSFVDKSLKQISILQNLVTIAGIQLENNGTFKGEMKCLEKDKIPKSYQLEYAQILVKSMYLSRRDQYKVLKTLGDRIFHVYNRKTLYFDSLKLEFTNLMHSNEQIRKTGIITKNTKIIFRSGCAKYTILIQISKQMFELNEDKELYLQKTIQFLLVFFQRNNFFNNKHRIQIIFFARLFYPQFSTLRQAYQCLQTDSKNVKGNVFTINYAVALQKDCKNRIYQDVYRRLLWPIGNINGFRQKFWERVSQFMFTINWQGAKSYAKNISESIEQNIQNYKIFRKSHNAVKIKPFLHRLPCQLAESHNSCLFEAISLISEQYKHHYYFRSLSETGNAITVISAGKSVYEVDLTTYKMAKSNVYLTNISCIHVNLRRKQHKVSVDILQLQKTPRYRKDDIKKLQNLLDWCIEEDAYKSPTNMHIEFADDFQLKSVIYPQNLQPCSDSDKKLSELYHYCPKKNHSINNQNPHKYVKHKQYRIQIEWISSIYMNKKSFQVHNFFYDNTNFEIDFIKKKQKKQEETDFSTFDRDLKIIISKKTNYGFSNLTHESILAKRINSYVVSAVRQSQEKKRRQNIELDQNHRNSYEAKYINKFFQISSLEDEQQRLNRSKDRKLVMSNCNSSDKDEVYKSLEISKQERRGSGAFDVTELDASTPITKVNKKQPGSVNIFEQTYKKKQYTPKLNLYKYSKKNNTHNMQRLKRNYRQSNLHYMMTYFNEGSIKDMVQFFKRPEPRTEEQKIIYQNFELQKEWKNIIFPILTPIYTNYRADLKSQQMNSKYSECGQMIIQQEVCKYLMENFQIQKENLNIEITMSKGDVHLLMKITTKDNITLFEAINLEKQKYIVPKMLYRYLCYEEKDYRFGAKSLNFSDQNYYTNEQKRQQKKAVKLVMIEEQIRVDGNYLKDFIKLLKQKYRSIKFDISYEPNLKEKKCEVYTVTIDLVEGMKNKIYRSEKIDVTFDVNFHPNCLYQIIVEWHYCCATYINQFIQNVISSARKSKIITHLVSKTNAFNTRWTTATIGQIIFQSKLAMDMLENNIIQTRNWLWQRQGYYMDRNGEAFIRFNKEKYLIEWYDNTIDKAKWKRFEAQNRFYQNFFMKSAAYDFIGVMIDSFTNNNSRKSSLALST